MKTQHLIRTATAVILSAVLFMAGCSKASKVSSKLNSAREYFGNGNYAAAEIEYKNLLELEPGHAQALKGLGLIRVKQGAMLEGGRILNGARQQLPADDEVAVNLALSMLDLGFVGDARNVLLEVLDRSSSNPEALMLLAESSFSPEAVKETDARIAVAKQVASPPLLLASAFVALRRGQIDSAEILIGQAIQADPGFTRALAMKATVLKYKKQADQALATMRQASDLAGIRSKESDCYAKWLMELGHKDEAVEFLEKATREVPDYLPKWRILGQIEFAAGNDQKAGECFSKVLANSPLDIEAGLFQAQLWLRHDEPVKAAELLARITRTFPSRPVLDLALARSQCAAGELVQASQTLDRVLAIAPDLSDAVILRTRLHLEDKQAVEAIRRIEPLANAEPNNKAVQELLIQAYEANNRTDDAVTLLRTQVTGSPDDPTLQFQLAGLLQKQGKSNEARAAFEQTVKLAPEHLGAISNLATMDLREGRIDQAMARVDRYLSKHQDSAEGILLKAGLCYSAKDFKAAEMLAKQSIQLIPDDIRSHAMLVRIQTDQGRTDDAAESLRQFVLSKPDHVAARMHLGSLLQQTGRSGEAHANFEEIVRLSPDFAPAYNNLAVIEAGDPGELGKALENARKAHELAPADPAICDTLGWIEWLRGNYREALTLLREAAGGLSENASVRYHLAMADYMMARIPEATDGFEKALTLQKEFPERPDAEKRLLMLRRLEQTDSGTLDELLKADPKDVLLLLEKARRIAATSRTDEAIAGYQKALAINPGLDVAHLGQAKLYASTLKQYDKAFDAAAAAREIAPQSPDAAAVLGAANFHLGRHEAAYSLLKEAVAKVPEDPVVQYDYAWAAYSMGRVDDARASMAMVAESSTNRSQDARQFLLLTSADAAKSPELPTLLETILTQSPDFVPALMARAGLEAAAGNSPAATYREVICQFPQFDPARKALARLCLNEPDQLDEAEKLANEARMRLKDDPDLSSVLGIVNHRKGKHEYAAQLLGEVASIRPLDGRELLALGLSQAAINRTYEARRNLEEAIRSNLSKEEESAARNALGRLDSADH